MAAASETSFEMQPGDSAPGETAASEGVVAEQASSGSSGGDAESNPPSPGRLIPAIKPELQRTSFQLHAWTVQLGYTTTLDGGSETAEAAPAWRRTWQWLAGAVSTVAVAVATLLPQGRRRRNSKELAAALASRTRSLEILSMGREQSAPYPPSKQLMLQQQQLQQPGALTVAVRWRKAVQAVADAREAARCLDLLANRLAPAEDRLHAVVVLATRLQGYPEAQRLAWALQARHGGARLAWGEYLLQELYITGERLFNFFTPPPMGGHRPYFVTLLAAVLVLLFFFMCGQYGQYQVVTAGPSITACLDAAQRNGTAPARGPGALVRWISPRAEQWCFGAPGPGRFGAQYLIDWGARWAPSMRSSPQRWLTSVLLHQTFTHLLSNTLLMLGFGWPLECKYGTWRIALLVLLAALGGNLLSAVTEAPCVAVVGASGVVFGLAGATIADMILNFETLGRPLLRTAVLLAFLIFFAVTVGTTAVGTSHMSHVGGFLCGLCPALVLLPNLHRGRAEAATAALGAAGTVAMFVALPCVFYLRLLPGLSC